MLAEGLELTSLPLGEPDVEVSLLDLTRLTDTESTVSWFLTPQEREEYTRLRHPARRREWLGARVCLKTMLLRRGCVSDPIECEVVKDTRGRPSLSFGPGPPANGVYDCSLSHKGRFACAGASSLMGTRVGVDIEEVSPRLLRLADAFARDRDFLIRPRPPQERLALLWAVKEACAKAVGVGLGVALGDVICEETAEGQLRVWTGDGLTFRARHLLHEGYVIALCLKQDEVRATGSSKTTTKERTPTMPKALSQDEKKEIYEHIRRFLSDELDVPMEDIGPDTKIIDDLKGDSMIYLELVEDFKKKYDVKVEISMIGRYLQKHPVYTVGQTAQVVYDIVERGDSLVASDAESSGPGT